MLARARTIVLVTLVTMLVWVFAEAEGLRSTETTIELAFDGEPGSDRTAELAAGAPGPMAATIVLEGAADAVDAVARRIRRGALTLSPGMEGVPKAPGEHVVVLRDVLREHPDLRARGVSIKKVEPETVRLIVDELATRELKVLADTPSGELESAPQVRPAQVKVTGPKRLLDALTEGAACIARVDPERWQRLVPGRLESLATVPVELPGPIVGSSRVRIDPPTVDITLTAKLRTLSVRLPSVPVHIRIAPGEMAKFDVDLAEQDRSLIDVTVTGPAELVQPIADKSRPLIAEVPLSYEELERGIPSKDAVFSGVPSTLKFEVANRTVRLTIKRRGPADGGPGKPPG